jgi:dTMP kinase
VSRGHFITLEGGEGAGKTTQSALLGEALVQRGYKVLRTREPGGAPGAELLRGILLGGAIDWSPEAETLLHFAARAEHVAKNIRPALNVGTWVVCDRFYDSTLAYQGYGQGADRSLIAEQIRLLGLHPDLTLVLDVPEPVASARMRQRGGDADRYERLDAEFHQRVREGFREIAEGNPARCILLDASGDIQAVHAAIMAAIPSSWLGEGMAI